MRRRVLDAANWRCASCGRPGKLEIDHIVPMERGGDAWDRSNLQVLCSSCHVAKTREENQKEVSPEVLAWRARVAELVDNRSHS